MAQRAVLICEELEGPALRLSRILDVFEIPWCTVDSHSVLSEPVVPSERYAILIEIAVLSRLVGRSAGGKVPALLRQAESVFLYAAEPSVTVETLRLVTGHPSPSVVRLEGTCVCSVSRNGQVCGPMSGLRIQLSLREPELALNGSGPDMEPLIAVAEGCVFGVRTVEGRPWFVSLSRDLIDVAKPVNKGFFDVTDSFLSSVPVVMYLRTAFEEMFPLPAEQGACLIIDDPVLRPKYGFVDFEGLRQAAYALNFSCTIAVIPWNWNRSSSSVIDLIKGSSDRLSISIHGCDHTANEFGGTNIGFLNGQAKLANIRMEKHLRRTGLAHDNLMIFPQGAFSTVAARVLKHNGFAAAVNTEVSPTDCPESTEIGDTWRMAMLRYADFPIFTRRYPFHGVHNFGFDLLLGKPCLLVTHHSDYLNRGRDVYDFIDKLNGLNAPLKWRPLGEVIRRAYRLRGSNDPMQVRMFGNEILLEATFAATRGVVVKKQEHEPSGVEQVDVGDRSVTFGIDGADLCFESTVESDKPISIAVKFKNVYNGAPTEQSIRSGGKVAIRRYLSEFRDESAAYSPRAKKFVGNVRKLMKGS